MTYIGNNLRYLRKLAGLSQQELAEKIGLNRGNIASYEKGSAEPKSVNMLKIAKYFNVDVNDFLEKELSKEVKRQNIEIFKSHNGISVKRESISNILEKVREDKTNTLQVIAENAAEIGKIVEGFRNFNKYRQAKVQDKEYDIDPVTLIYEYSQLLELTEDLLDMNRQLLILAKDSEKS